MIFLAVGFGMLAGIAWTGAHEHRGSLLQLVTLALYFGCALTLSVVLASVLHL